MTSFIYIFRNNLLNFYSPFENLFDINPFSRNIFLNIEMKLFILQNDHLFTFQNIDINDMKLKYFKICHDKIFGVRVSFFFFFFYKALHQSCSWCREPVNVNIYFHIANLI